MTNISLSNKLDESQQKLWEYELERFRATGQCPLCNGQHGNNTFCQAYWNNPLDGGL